MTTDADYVSGMKTTRIYLSKEFQKDTVEGKRPARFISRVFESGERDCMVAMKGEAVLRVTLGGREQVKALFYVDDRSIDHILLQRFNTGSNAPQRVAHFSLRGSEIKKVVGLLKLVESGTIAGQDKFRIEESDLQDFAVSDDAARSLARSNPELIAEIARNEITKKDVIAVAYRKNVLERFRKMLDDDTFFGSEKTRLSKLRDEDVWQALFEENP